MNTWLKSIVSVGALAFVGLTSSVVHAETKIAVVDIQRAVMQTEEGMRAQATLKKLFDNRQQELNKKQQDLLKQKEDIEKQAKVSKDAAQKRAEEWQKQMMELQATFVDYNKEIEKKQKEMTDPIYEKVIGIIKRMATTEGFDVVIDRATTAYVKAELDVTDRAIQMYNTAARAPGK